MINLGEANLFFALVITCLVEVLGYMFVFWQWKLVEFSGFDMIRFILVMTHVLCILGFAGVGLLGMHVFKKAT